MGRSRTNVLVFVTQYLTKMKREAAYERLGRRHYLHALIHTSLLSGERTGLSAQMRVHTATGAAGKCEQHVPS
jgi:hypothetical protein